MGVASLSMKAQPYRSARHDSTPPAEGGCWGGGAAVAAATTAACARDGLADLARSCAGRATTAWFYNIHGSARRGRGACKIEPKSHVQVVPGSCVMAHG